MHELSVAQSLIQAATTEAVRMGALRVTGLLCRIGSMRQIDDWLIREAFEVVAAGTVCESATLSIERTYMQVRCRACQRLFPVRDWIWACPTCGAEGENPTGGDELELVSLDVDIAETDEAQAGVAARNEGSSTLAP